MTHRSTHIQTLKKHLIKLFLSTCLIFFILFPFLHYPSSHPPFLPPHLPHTNHFLWLTLPFCPSVPSSHLPSLQYGAFERCKELIEGGYDINKRDGENVTLLHWAAINNRREIVRLVARKMMFEAVVCVLLDYFFADSFHCLVFC